ncbi:hypothetical protein AAMO2058_000213000 [Amorphochlora amoebiformis]|uniref:Sugar phosphate transporter domain-containing protein n=1 Tax=Amorphochlora amoebiformis TaxID=1561963 RepID=A0A7S0H5A7_9EUKA
MARVGEFIGENCNELAYALTWWSFSILFSLYNKEVFGEKKLNFPCPLLLTSSNFLFQWLAASLIVRCYNRLETTVEPLDWSSYRKRVIPCAVGLAMDIALSNLSLIHVTVSFYTMIKASAPIFGLIFAIIFGLERPTCEVFGVVILIVLGLSIVTKGESDFSWTGFLTVFTATAMSGLRWNLLQILLQAESRLPTPMHVLKVVSPIAGVCIFTTSIFLETPWDGDLFKFTHQPDGLVRIFLIVFIGGFFAVGLSLSSFALLQRTSVLMFMAFGALKEILQILLSVLTYGDKLGPNSFVGILLVLLGVVLYKYSRLRRRVVARQDIDGSIAYDSEEGVEKSRLLAPNHLDGIYNHNNVSSEHVEVEKKGLEDGISSGELLSDSDFNFSNGIIRAGNGRNAGSYQAPISL